MLDTEAIPNMAHLHKEEDGVTWSTGREGVNTIHYMEFKGWVLTGSWVGPHWVFWALTSISPEERERNLMDTHDACMGAIAIRLSTWRGELSLLGRDG